MKKGFTLVEIIICIVLLGIISVSFLIVTINKDDDKEKNKIINNVVDAADVYYSVNMKKEDILNNYGYYVLNIETLKELGVLDNGFIIPTLTDEEREAGKDYSKLVIDINSEKDLGFINYIYPYEKTMGLIIELNDISIEYEEKDMFECNSLLEYIGYLDEDYKKIKVSDYECGIYNIVGEVDNTDYHSEIILNNGDNTLAYKFKINDKDVIGDRTVTVSDPLEINLKAEIDDGTNNDYICGEWVNKNIKLTLEGNTRDRDINYLWKQGSNNIGNDKEVTVTTTGNYSGSYELKFKLSGDNKTETFSCNIKIDTILPTITKTINKDRSVTLSFSDNDSGIFKYIISDSPLSQANQNKTYFESNGTYGTTKTIISEHRTKTKYIYVMDKAGNISYTTVQIIGMEVYPIITYEPIKGSFSKFKVTVKGSDGKNYDISSIKVQYVYADQNLYKKYDKCVNNNSNTCKEFGDSYEWFNENLNYNSSYNSSKFNYINYKDYINDYTCNGKECSFVIDMDAAAKDCFEVGSGSSSVYSYKCRRALDSKVLNNYNLHYYIYVKNNEGYYRELKLNSILNIDFLTSAFSGYWFGYQYWSKDDGYTNEDGNILFIEKNRNKDRYYFYYHDSKNLTNKEIDSYNYMDDANNANDMWHHYITEFTSDRIEYVICRNYWKSKKKYREYYIYEYDIINDNLKEIENDDSKTSNSCGAKFDNIDYEQYSNIKLKEIDKENFISNYLSRIDDWDKKSITNPTEYSISNTFSKNIFYTNYNGDIYYSNMINEKESRNDYDKVIYLPEVSLRELSNNVGK